MGSKIAETCYLPVMGALNGSVAAGSPSLLEAFLLDAGFCFTLELWFGEVGPQCHEKE